MSTGQSDVGYIKVDKVTMHSFDVSRGDVAGGNGLHMAILSPSCNVTDYARFGFDSFGRVREGEIDSVIAFVETVPFDQTFIGKTYC